MLAPRDLAGRTAVVTGAAHGIGRAITRRLMEHDARVVAIDIDRAGLEEAFQGRECTKLEGDLGAEDAQTLAAAVLQKHGPVELLVNNVGIETPHRFEELGEADFDRVMRTNLRGPWFFTKHMLAELIAAGRTGAVLFVSSLHDTFVYGKPHYSASKAAVAMLTKELARAFGPRGIRVNAISPGGIKSDAEEGDELSDPRVPLGRVGVPDDVARMAVVLLSDELSGYVTGANLAIDGGAALPDIWGRVP